MGKNRSEENDGWTRELVDMKVLQPDGQVVLKSVYLVSAPMKLIRAGHEVMQRRIKETENQVTLLEKEKN